MTPIVYEYQHFHPQFICSANNNSSSNNNSNNDDDYDDYDNGTVPGADEGEGEVGQSCCFGCTGGNGGGCDGGGIPIGSVGQKDLCTRHAEGGAEAEDGRVQGIIKLVCI